jgi:hypothetical protein
MKRLAEIQPSRLPASTILGRVVVIVIVTG